MRDLDELMFASSGWFTIDASNQRVRGVVVTSLDQGLSLVGQGTVTAVVGRLRPEMRVVDVDLEGPRGDAAVESIAHWCRSQGLWHLVRPSGGAPGRAHVFVATEGAAADLMAHAAELRASLRAGAQRIDVRDTVRPLSSPHRSGASTTPLGRLFESLLGLRGHDWADPAIRHTSRSSRRTTPRSPTSVIPAHPQRAHQRRPLPSVWQAYVDHGARPLLRDTDPDTRSTVEAAGTAALLRAGHDADTAWQVIAAAHEQAFAKARSRGRAWWVKYVWNRAVDSDDEFLPQRSSSDVDDHVAAAVHAARGALDRLAWTLPTRRRPALLLVGHTVLDRMLRTNTLRVPVPERDVVLDTGITDRKTVRAHLRLLDQTVGVLHRESWDPNKRDATSFEFEIPELTGVWEIPPPSLHTPTPTVDWSVLPRLCHTLWRHLGTQGGPVSAEDLAFTAGVTEQAGDVVKPHQIRATRVALAALAGVGLAMCTAEGMWLVDRRVSGAHRAAARAHRRELEAAVAEERRMYREGRPTAWSVARAAAHKAQRAREIAWWQGLPAAERVERRASRAVVFAALSIEEQEVVKRKYADRRVRLGVDEQQRYRDWIDGLSADELTRRSVERTAAFAALPSPVQRASVESWDRHRARYGLPRGTLASATRLEQSTLLPLGADVRDEQYWRQETLLPDANAAHHAGA